MRQNRPQKSPKDLRREHDVIVTMCKLVAAAACLSVAFVCFSSAVALFPLGLAVVGPIVGHGVIGGLTLAAVPMIALR